MTDKYVISRASRCDCPHCPCFLVRLQPANVHFSIAACCWCSLVVKPISPTEVEIKQ